MSWCCNRPENLDGDTVELKIRDVLDNTEAWLTKCKNKKSEHIKQRTLNQQRRSKLETNRIVLLNDKIRVEEELLRVKNELIAIDGYFAALDDAENELDRMENELALEEAEMLRKEGAIKDHLSSIATITEQQSHQSQAQAPRVTPQAIAVVTTLSPPLARDAGCLSPCVSSPVGAAVAVGSTVTLHADSPATVAVSQ